MKKTELEDADGTTAMKSFQSPADALKWQAENQGDRTVPVYLLDGKTVIGEFLIVGQATQQKVIESSKTDG